MRPIVELNKLFHYISAIVLLTLMFMTVGDVAGRYLFNRPITGTFELTGLLTAVAVFLGFGYAHVQGEHVTIDLIYDGLAPGYRRVLDVFGTVFTIGVLIALTRGLIHYAGRMEAGGYTTSVLRVPIWPFVWATILGTAAHALVAMVDLGRHILHYIRRSSRP